jgi:quinol monooxygenase YgiN
VKPRTVAIMLAGTLCLGSLSWNTRSAAAQARPDRLVRIAELEIDPGQLEAYRSALREEIEASIRIEPGVLTLYAVAVKDQPNQIRLFEVYAGTAEYQAHLQSAHFLKYKNQTVHMVKSLKLIETEPLLLGSK